MNAFTINKIKLVILPAAVLLLVFCLPAKAQESGEVAELKKLLAEQQKVLEQLQERIAQLEARQRIKEESLEKKIDEVSNKTDHIAEETEKVAAKTEKVEKAQAEAPRAELPDAAKWVERIKFSGDFRYRHEHIDAEEVGSVRWKNGRDRDRIRARLLMEAIVNDEWDVAFRLATGERDLIIDEGEIFNDPLSSNQTLTQEFSGKDWWIDLAFFHWHPENFKGLSVYGGKIKNPFYKPGKTELIWDGDLNPEGIGAKYAVPLGGADTIFVNGGGFWIDEESGGADTSLWGVQTYWKHDFGNPDYILGGVSYFDYGNIRGRQDIYGTLAGNTPLAGAAVPRWGSDFDLIELFAEYGTEIRGLPIAFFGDVVQNQSADTSRDTGWLVGTKFGDIESDEPGTWQARYNYRELEADAVLGAFTDSDFIGGGTDGRGHEVGLNYQLYKNVTLGLTYFHNENDRGGQARDLDFRRFQGDLIFKFK